MGAGNGYWGKLLQLRGVDIICYDLHVAGEDEEEQMSGDEKERNSGDEEQQAEGESNEQEDESEDDGEGSVEDHEESRSDEEDDTKDVHNEVGATGDGEDDDDGDDDDFNEDDEDEEVEVEQIYWTDVHKGTPKVRFRAWRRGTSASTHQGVFVGSPQALGSRAVLVLPGRL